MNCCCGFLALKMMGKCGIRVSKSRVYLEIYQIKNVQERVEQSGQKRESRRKERSVISCQRRFPKLPLKIIRSINCYSSVRECLRKYPTNPYRIQIINQCRILEHSPKLKNHLHQVRASPTAISVNTKNNHFPPKAKTHPHLTPRKRNLYPSLQSQPRARKTDYNSVCSVPRKDTR